MPTIWSECGLWRATTKERAHFWREVLLGELDDLVSYTDVFPDQLVPIIKDLPTYPRHVLGVIAKRGTLRKIHDPRQQRSLDWCLRELREQIENASSAQIVAYAEAFYNRENR